MKKKKFSQFEFPQNPAEIYLVGYEVGTGEDGENMSVQVKASDLAFSVSGAAGVSSVNGISGSVFINAGDGVQLTQTGNGITISAKNELIIDNIFDSESDNPQSGTAINAELTKYANLETSNIFSGDVQMKNLNIVGKLRVNAPAAFNDEVSISGRNVSESIVNASAHIASSDLHLTSEKSAVISQAESHINDTQAHINPEERASLENVDNKLDMKDFYGTTYTTLETVPTGGGDEWDACRIAAQNVPHDFAIKYITFKALKANDIPLFLAVFRREGNNRSLIAVTENSNTWGVGDNVTWRLPLPVIIAENTGLEIITVRSASDVSGGNVTASGIKFKSPITSGSDAVLFNNVWYFERGVYVEFASDGHVGDSSHITHAERIILERLLERADELLALL